MNGFLIRKTPKFWSGDKIKSKDGKHKDIVLFSDVDGRYKLQTLGEIHLNENEWVFDEEDVEESTEWTPKNGDVV